MAAVGNYAGVMAKFFPPPPPDAVDIIPRHQPMVITLNDTANKIQFALRKLKLHSVAFPDKEMEGNFQIIRDWSQMLDKVKRDAAALMSKACDLRNLAYFQSREAIPIAPALSGTLRPKNTESKIGIWHLFQVTQCIHKDIQKLISLTQEQFKQKVQGLRKELDIYVERITELRGELNFVVSQVNELKAKVLLENGKKDVLERNYQLGKEKFLEGLKIEGLNSELSDQLLLQYIYVLSLLEDADVVDIANKTIAETKNISVKVQASYQLAFYFYKNDYFAQAFDLLLPVVAHADEFWKMQIHRLLSDSYLENGQKAEAIAALNEALKCDPLDPAIKLEIETKLAEIQK